MLKEEVWVSAYQVLLICQKCSQSSDIHLRPNRSYVVFRRCPLFDLASLVQSRQTGLEYECCRLLMYPLKVCYKGYQGAN